MSAAFRTLRSLIFATVLAPPLCWAQAGLPSVPAERLEPIQPGVEAALLATGLSMVELRNRWGLLVDLVDTRWLEVDGKSWRAFEWIEPGLAMRQWVSRCGLFGACFGVDEITIRSVSGNLLESKFTSGAPHLHYLSPQPDGKLAQKATPSSPSLGSWEINGSRQLLKWGKVFRQVDAEMLAKATEGGSSSLELGAANKNVVAAVASVNPGSAGTPRTLAGGTMPAARTPTGSGQPAPPGTQRVPEALFVCSRPDASGRFFCDSPAQEGIEGNAGTSPHALVASAGDVCPSRRRLYSRTHLVWGCGIGATGAPKFADRGQGVDVRGRGAYHCLPQETDCQRVDL